MPTYQYACTDCAHRFEEVQSFTDDSLTTCPVCSGQLRKVYGAVGVVFKGSGFYRTDSRAGAPKSEVGAGSGDKAEKTGGKAESGGAAKGAEKKASSDSAGGSAGSSSKGSSGSGSSGSGSSGGGSSSGGSSGGGSSSGGSSGSGSSSSAKAAAS